MAEWSKRSRRRDTFLFRPTFVGRIRPPTERYQTVFARHPGSSAAPTAALHVTNDTLARLAARHVSVAFVTLHVGIGTFRPVSADDLDAHPMHPEELTVGPELVKAVCDARAGAPPSWPLERRWFARSNPREYPANPGLVCPFSGSTRLLIQPGYAFGPVDSLLTNFHMPKSTLMALVSAFAGRERVFDAYRTALDAGYRFLSYGDAMWIPNRLS